MSNLGNVDQHILTIRQKGFGRVAERIELFKDDEFMLKTYLNGLFYDDRCTRQGFPSDVLLAISEIKTMLVVEDKDIWSSSVF